MEQRTMHGEFAEQKQPHTEHEKFTSPEEELAYLRNRVHTKEKEIASHQNDFERARIAKREVIEYQDTPSHEVLSEAYHLSEEQVLHTKLALEPEEHDVQMEELITMIQERGIKNTLAVVKKMGSAHLEDDIHRILVRYVAEGLPTQGLAVGSEEWRALHMVLYEVSLSQQSSEDAQHNTAQDLERLLGVMEQFYAGLLSVVGTGVLKKQEVFSVEIAKSQESEEAIFYVSIPRARHELFEKHMTATYPHAHIDEIRGDYNIFNYGGAHRGAYGKLKKNAVLPLKTYTDFSHDPLNIVLSAFSQLQKHGEGAAIQFVIGESGDLYNKQYRNVVRYLHKGEKLKKAIAYGTKPFAEAADELKKGFADALLNRTNQAEKEKHIDELAIEHITKKMKSKIVPTTIRIVASAHDDTRAGDILHAIQSTFKQFEDAQGNELVFQEQRGSSLRALLHAFSFRTFALSHLIPLSLAELATMYHLSGEGISSSRELKQSRAKQVAAPIGVGMAGDTNISNHEAQAQNTPNASSAPTVSAGTEGIILGKNIYGGSETRVTYLPEDRMRHFYEIGQTGVGKTVLMKNMIIQDIQQGHGCCYIDPHGSDIVDVLAAVPEDRYDDVIYFDPAHMETPMALNMLEFDPQYPEQKTFVVNELFSIFEKLFMDKSPESLGPMFEQYFRNATILLLEGMEPGTATMADIPRIFSDENFRHACIERSQNHMVNQFWTDIAEAAGGDASLENIVPYITAKTDIFLTNDIMRPIISQEKSVFNFRDIMDNKKILLVNLAKGRLGDINSELLGLIIVGKFLQAALSRVDDVTQGKEIADFYLYIDEFQNFTTPSIATILSEARKYRLSLNIAHQYISQLDDRIRNAVFGNVGTKCIFRVSMEDAEILEKQFQPEFSASDIAGLDNRNAYVSLLVGGRPARPFNMVTLSPQPVDFAKVEYLKQMSYTRYGRPREEVLQEFNSRYHKPKGAQAIPDFGEEAHHI